MVTSKFGCWGLVVGKAQERAGGWSTSVCVTLSQIKERPRQAVIYQPQQRSLHVASLVL